MSLLSPLYPLAKNILFKLDPEVAHHLTMNGLSVSEKAGLFSGLSLPPHWEQPVECMGLKFPNPVGLAAGLDKEGSCIDALGRMGFGFIEIGTITPIAQPGNPKPRLFRIPPKEALINRFGFNNPGIERGVQNVSESKHFEGLIGFNIGKNKITPNSEATEDYLKCLQAAFPVADYITVNLSSPNTPGLRDLQSADLAEKLVTRLREEQVKLEKEYGKKVPIALKVAPDLTEQEVEDLSKGFLRAGLEGLIATNTTISRDAVKGEKYGEEAGGLSGAPLTQKSTEIIAAFHSHLGSKVPIIGVGGIMSGQDALDKLQAGASLVQVYSGFIYKGPALVSDILETCAQASCHQHSSL